MAPRMRNAALVLCLALLAAGCGGSSSETPPPLEPDPTSSRYTGPRVTTGSEESAPRPAASEAEDPLPEQPSQSARATWGSGKPAPAPAPSMTSPNAPPAPSASP